MNMLRDQTRARHAYASVGTVPPEHREDYKIAVNAFGAHVIRSGLCAAIAWLQRRCWPSDTPIVCRQGACRGCRRLHDRHARYARAGGVVSPGRAGAVG